MCYENVGLSYGGGGVVCKDAGVCGGDAAVPVVGVFDIYDNCWRDDWRIDLEKTPKSGRIKRS